MLQVKQPTNNTNRLHVFFTAVFSMTDSIQSIPLPNLALAFLPVLGVILIIHRWRLGAHLSLYALIRMLAQLLLIGYVLAFIFRTEQAWVVLLVLLVMLLASSWIALREIKLPKHKVLLKSFIAIALPGSLLLLFVTQAVLGVTPWFLPNYVIPLAGMVFANAMNSVSLAGERLQAELGKQSDFKAARNTAFQASMIPITNALFSVGLVSLPGMMTGQILSGVSPLLAVRYQIMIMCMVYAVSGISSAFYLVLIEQDYKNK